MADLYKKYSTKGLEIMAFPCNQFGSQEPGSRQEIKAFAKVRQNAEYLLFDKCNVNGANASDVFKFLRFNSELYDPVERTVGHIQWNFGFFLVDKTGKKIQYFNPRQDHADVAKAVKNALK